MKSRKFVSVLLPFSASRKPLQSPERSPAPCADVQDGRLGKELAVGGDFAAEQAPATGVTPACIPQFPLLKSICSNNL